MKFHLCSLNWTPWSKVVEAYSGKVQTRKCTICNKVNTRDVEYGNGVHAGALNEALDNLEEVK